MKTRKRSTLTALALVVSSLAALILVPTTPQRARAQDPAPPNVVLIVSDDQRWDMVSQMHHVETNLADQGKSFTQATIANSLCCPSRTTILTGTQSHTNGVWTNDPAPHGGWPAFVASGYENNTVGAWLHDAGYRTGFFGKFLNWYAPQTDPADAIPYGWDEWQAFVKGSPGAAYYNYDVWSSADGGTLIHHGSFPADYSTRVVQRAVVSFVNSTPPDTPLFAYVAPFGPHAPATPDPRDAGSYANAQLPTPPNFDEANVSDKPPFIQALPALKKGQIQRLGNRYRGELESLEGVDRGVGAILEALNATGRLSNTLVIFLSDNGLANGEHRWTYKLAPYEESVRVPLIIRWDGHVAPGTSSPVLAQNVDLAETIADAAGAIHPPTEGESLLGTGPTRPYALLEHLTYRSGRAPDPPSYCGVRSATWTFVHYDDGFEELYNLSKDPYELKNIAASHLAKADALRDVARSMCSPLPPEMAPF